MVIRPAIPNGYSFVHPLKTSAHRRMTPTSIAALVAVGAAHLGLAVYLYGAHFAPAQLATPPDPAPVFIEIPRLAPEPPPTPAHRLQPRTLPVHVEQRVAIQADQTIEVQPPPRTPQVIDTGKVSLLASDAGGEAAAPPRPRPVITDPHWLRQPTADEFADAYPRRALDVGKAGVVSLTCTVAASGDLADCSVTEESPTGWGFGAAALSLSKRFRLVPREEDGRPTGGALVRIPIRFALRN